MIKLKQVTKTFSDATAGYSVELTKEYTLQEFVNEVLKNKQRWGYLAIDSEISIFGDPRCEYKHGELLNKFPSEILTKKVVSAKARGGYGSMDYSIELKNEKCKLRTIKFRGKRIDNGEWIYGDLINNPEFRNGLAIGLYNNHSGNSIDTPPYHSYDFFEVHSKSVGQYTGLKDKEDKELYEGDICIVNDGFVGKKRLVRYIDEKAAFMFEILEDVEAADFRKLKGELRFISEYDHQTSDKIEVIGNIHDNPELL